MEVWKDIVGFEGCYWVSNKGRVKSRLGYRILKLHVATEYHRVHLLSGDKRLSQYVHRLVAVAFLGEPPEGDYVVNHIDENKLNNNVENLEWVSRTYNVIYSMFNKLSEDEKARFIQHVSC